MWIENPSEINHFSQYFFFSCYCCFSNDFVIVAERMARVTMLYWSFFRKRWFILYFEIGVSIVFVALRSPYSRPLNGSSPHCSECFYLFACMLQHHRCALSSVGACGRDSLLCALWERRRWKSVSLRKSCSRRFKNFKLLANNNPPAYLWRSKNENAEAHFHDLTHHCRAFGLSVGRDWHFRSTASLSNYFVNYEQFPRPIHVRRKASNSPKLCEAFWLCQVSGWLALITNMNAFPTNSSSGWLQAVIIFYQQPI